MLENPTPTAPPDAVKRYAPPNQRNRSLNRRKSDRFNNYYVNDGERNQPHGAASRSVPVADHDGDVGSSNVPNESSRPGLIALEGCSRGEASQLLSDRWAAVMNSYNDTSIDLSERPVMYSGSSGSTWPHMRLPHQVMAASNNVGSSGQPIDFLSELCLAIRNANARSDN
uniref:Uncharacterized protein MANES_13G058400 n=2 Tax=Rhizophora mucronata TaxID=61149 RepID=A0A2P2MDM3_RHIMU